MVICRIRGGIGNQMFQYATAAAIANQNCDTLKLDISSFESNKLREYSLNRLSINTIEATPKEIKKIAGIDTFVFKALRRLGKIFKQLRPFYKIAYKKGYFLERGNSVYDETLFNFTDIYLDGYWQNEKYFVSIRSDLLKKFSISELSTGVKEQYLPSISETDSVSLHIRRGDYTLRPQLGVIGLDYYKRAVQYVTERIKDATFYVFSDDQAWCEDNLSFIENKVLVKNTKTDTDDLFLMSKCDHNIIANSSFSWWGAWLNDTPQKIVIAPNKWREDTDPGDIDIVPRNWVKL